MRFSQIALLVLLPGGALAADRPNILFIYTDDQSHRTVSCYPEAYKWVKTPNIDRLAGQGVRFTHAYVGTWCMPSRATMLTGRHQYGVKSMRMEGRYPGSTYDPKESPFWPSVFRAAGYHTAQIGKWHTGVDTGFGRDWDYQVVWNRPRHPANAGNYYGDQLIEINGKPAAKVGGYTTDWYTDRAAEYIRGGHRDGKKPWYLWLCYGAVHGPYTPAERHRAAYDGVEVPLPGDIFPERSGKPEYVRKRDTWVRGKDGGAELNPARKLRTVKNMPLHGNDLQAWVRQYHQGVLAIDEAVGRLLETLRETGQDRNTLVVFAADQGIAWGQHGFQQKIAPYDANIRGPLIMSFPGVIPAGGVCPSPVGGTDLPPTFFGFAGLKLPWKMHGHDLAPLLKKPGRRWEHPALTILTGQSFGADTDRVPVDPAKLYATAKVPWWVSLAKGRHKYIRTLVKGEIEELYDLEKDPGELHNLALEPAHRTRLRAMRAATIAELKRTDAVMADHLPAVGTPE